MPHVLAQDLRNAVLQAAFKGELTKRNTNDRSASEYLNDIYLKQKRLATSKAIKIGKYDTNVKNDFDFDFPNEWELTKIGKISSLVTKQTGFDYSKYIKPNLLEGKHDNCYPLIQTRNFKGEDFDFDSKYYLPIEVGNEYPNLVLNNPCLLLSIVGASIGNVGLYNHSTVGFIGGAISKVNLIDNASLKYVFYYLQSPLGNYQIMKNYKSTAQGTITVEDVRNIIVPFPSIEEQARIVAKVDELMAKIDEYEKIEKELTELQKAFPGNMKDAILQAAMQGKLTEQLEKDENVYGLIKEISFRDKKWKPIDEDELPFTIPDNWGWMRLREFSTITAGGTPNRSEPRYWNGNIPWLKIGNLTSKYVTEADEFITEDGLSNSSAKWVKKGTILYSIFASIGTVAILDFEATTNQAIAAVTINERMNRDYMYYVLTALKSVLVGQGHGMAQMNINQEILKNTPIPIPPIEEQQRIVDKLDRLLPLCESLEAMI